MNEGNHARELRGGAETMRSNDATWDTIESRRAKSQEYIWRSTLGLDVNKSDVRNVHDHRISRNCATGEFDVIDARQRHCQSDEV
jgi:hypothetical protein